MHFVLIRHLNLLHFLSLQQLRQHVLSYFTSQVARNILTPSIVLKWRTVSAHVLVFTRLDDLRDGHVKR